MFSGKPRFITNSFGNITEKRVTKSIGERIEMNVSVQGNPKPQVVYNNFEIQTEFVQTSNTKYDIFIKKLVSSEYDFRNYTLIIGNSQGNVTIIIEAERKRKSSAKFDRYVVAVPLVVLILISILVPTLIVIKRRKHNIDNQENSIPANNDDTENNRETFLRQSFDSSVGIQTRRHSLDVTNTDSFDSDFSNQVLAACFEVDEASSTMINTMEESRLNIESDLKIKSNTGDSALEEQQSIPGNPDPHLENSEERKKVMSKKQTRCRGVGKIQITF
ncbi:hypothetical protein KUTeg_006509 [Tegillarca granosa]|uniref:Allorecognition 2 n=1 Tax=Tegillarca granosa TaxID=220873 RepID=A0ABQ9FJP3_TEGGR|nr:hypothetical protein KUTeg_006509 [Tegillarca granosa]